MTISLISHGVQTISQPPIATQIDSTPFLRSSKTHYSGFELPGTPTDPVLEVWLVDDGVLGVCHFSWMVKKTQQTANPSPSRAMMSIPIASCAV